MDILLNDACLSRRARGFFDDVLQLVPVLGYLDALTLIGALTRFCDPDVVSIAMVLVVLFKCDIVRVTQPFLNMESHW